MPTSGLKADAITIGQSATDSQNFQWSANNDGTAKLARGSDGSLGDILTIASDGDVKLTKTTATSMVRLNTANGYGSTNTKIRRFTNVVTNQGTDITYADSATLGASFTINTNGVYAISYSENFTSGNDFGISLNSTAATTAVQLIPVGEVLSLSSTAGASYSSNCGWQGYLSSGSVIRAHGDSGASSSVVAAQQFTITRVA